VKPDYLNCEWYDTMQLRDSPRRWSNPQTVSPERIVSIGFGPSGIETSVPATKHGSWVAR
jgi:hypothetical protein